MWHKSWYVWTLLWIILSMPGKLIWPSVDCWNVSVSESQSPLSCLGVRGKKQQGMSDRSTLHKSIVGPWELMGPLWAHRHTHSHTHTQTHWVIQSHLIRSTLTCCSNTDTQTHKHKHRLTHKHKRTKDNGARPTSWPDSPHPTSELKAQGPTVGDQWWAQDGRRFAEKSLTKRRSMRGYVGSTSLTIITSSHQIRTVESLSWRKTPKLSQNRSKDVSEASSKRENHNPSHRLLFLFGV